MKTKLKELYRSNKSFLVFLALMFVFRSAVADWNEVPTGSMLPTIVEGDRILVNKMAYDIRLPFTHVSLVKLDDPKHGDIIIFDSEVSDIRLVKRVVGVPGDVVQMVNNELIINGNKLSYKNISGVEESTDQQEDLMGIQHFVRVKKEGSRLSSFDPVVVPVDYYLALGDNRDNSSDSRVIGFIPRNEIVGRAKSVVLSLNYENYYIPRSGRFFKTL